MMANGSVNWSKGFVAGVVILIGGYQALRYM